MKIRCVVAAVLVVAAMASIGVVAYYWWENRPDTEECGKCNDRGMALKVRGALTAERASRLTGSTLNGRAVHVAPQKCS